MASDEAPKIIVDDDWKTQAKAEKERLAKEAEEKAAAAPAGPGSPPGAGEKLGFSDLVRMLATQALMYMGAYPDPQTGKAIVALDVAKIHVDLLDVLEQKTKGNLSDEETKMLTGMLSELRVQFVEIARAVQQAQQEGRIGPEGEIRVGGDGAPGPGGMPTAPPPGL